MSDGMNVPTGQVLIDGEWGPPSSGEVIAVQNPSDGGDYACLARGQASDIDMAVASSRAAAEGDWGDMPAFERGRLMHRLSQRILDHVEELALMEARDVGKPLTQARADAVACARYFEFYAGAADKLHGDTIPYLEGYSVMTFREPHGVTGHIIPWNYPMQILGRSIGAALATGNACVLKPAEDAGLTSLAIGELARQVGFPPGAFNIVPGYGEEAGQALIDHPGIDHISFTGSPEVGTIVQKAAAVFRRPVTLELGGKSPQVVFADVDMENALPFLSRGFVQNAGQTCSAGSRLLVEDSAYDRVTEMVAEKVAALTVGPADRDMDCGPVINKQQYDRVNAYLDLAAKDGLTTIGQAQLAANAPSEGYYVPPTVIGDVPPDHRLAQEEIFGPVLTCIRFKDEADAIRIANGTSYGLAAGVWTEDVNKAMRLGRKIKAGQVFINNYGAGGGVELPFGGMKGSGFGREKGFEALLGFTATKTIAVKHG